MFSLTKNILYIGPYRQVDGWGYAAKNYILSLLHTPHNIYIQNLHLGSSVDLDMPKEILELEKKIPPIEYYDIIIQHTLPHLLEAYPGIINIATFFMETARIDNSCWVDKLNQMDMIWIASECDKRKLLDNGVIKPVYVIPIPSNIPDKLEHILLSKPFRFYYIGTLETRKNIRDLLIAYYREFKEDDNVDLTLKIPKGQGHVLYEYINQLISVLRLKYYASVEIIDEFLSENELEELHLSSHCFITTSYGEAWCIPAFDAMKYGSLVIAPRNCGISEFLTNCVGYMIHTIEVPLLDPHPPIQEVYDGYNSWNMPIMASIQKHMREAYNISADEYRIRTKVGSHGAKKFTHEKVAEKIKRCIIDYEKI